MIHPETALKVQACLDGELPPAEARRVAGWLAQDPELRLLGEELRGTKALLVGNEPEFSVPESREFYWSKIARELQPTSSLEMAPGPSRLWWWLRVAVPLGSTLVLAAVLLLRSGPGAFGSRYLATGHEIETPLEEMASITFRSESARMTVVWVDTSMN